MTKTRTLTMTALMTAVICIFAPISIPIPVSPVALTLGTFAMYLTAYVLPPRQALAAIGLYLLLGAAGLPVFSGYTAGLSRFAAPRRRVSHRISVSDGHQQSVCFPFSQEYSGTDGRIISGNHHQLYPGYRMDGIPDKHHVFTIPAHGSAGIPALGYCENHHRLPAGQPHPRLFAYVNKKERIPKRKEFSLFYQYKPLCHIEENHQRHSIHYRGNQGTSHDSRV